MKYLSVCSGIEAATVAWHPLGFHPVAFAEIEKFPCALLAHHYPTVPNWGDLTQFKEWPDANIDLLVGGTPCQSFSVAGLRAGLDDPRGNLALTYLAVADKYRPRWLVWENVPGVLSSNGGRDFGAFLGGLGELGYGFAYRVLDAQYFGLAQRRKRVFVVAHLGDWRRAAAVLFERESLSGHPAPSREAGQGVANAITERPDRGGGNSEGQRLIPDITPTLSASGQGVARVRGKREEEDWLIAHTLRGEGFDASEDGCGRGTPIIPALAQTLTTGGTGERGYNDPTNATLVPIAFSAKDYGADAGDIAPTLRAGGFTNSHANGGVMPAVAFNWQSGGDGRGLKAQAQALSRSQTPAVAQHGMAVRRLTPRECERLQGFPDDYTLIPYRGKHAADGPRYKALGNSMAVPCMAWIGRRIALVDALAHELERTA